MGPRGSALRGLLRADGKAAKAGVLQPAATGAVQTADEKAEKMTEAVTQ
jgi:hypothetical protein